MHVNKEIENFYRPMYTSTINGENDDQLSQLNKSFEDFIELALNIPKLGGEEQQSLEKDGFVNGRYIGQNIRLLCDLLEYSDVKNFSGILLFVNFEKAFDTLEWSFISKTLKVFQVILDPTADDGSL